MQIDVEDEAKHVVNALALSKYQYVLAYNKSEYAG